MSLNGRPATVRPTGGIAAMPLDLIGQCSNYDLCFIGRPATVS